MLRYRVLFPSIHNHHYSIFVNIIHTLSTVYCQILHYKSSSYAKDKKKKKLLDYYRKKTKKTNKIIGMFLPLILYFSVYKAGFLWTYCTLRPHVAKRKRVCFACTQYLTPGPDRPLGVRSRAGASLTGPGPRQS